MVGFTQRTTVVGCGGLLIDDNSGGHQMENDSDGV